MASRKPRISVSAGVGGASRKPRVSVSASLPGGGRRKKNSSGHRNSGRRSANSGGGGSMGKSFAFLLIICLMILGGAYFFGGRLPGVSLGWNRINFDFSNFFKSSSTLERPNKDFEPKEFKAVVVNVHDGDTVTVVNDKNQKYKVRLWGIDAPELAQDGGQSSQRYLKNLIDAKEVDIMVQDVDKYSRLLAVIYLGDQMVNGEMVLAGHAWWYEHFAPNAVDLANYEQEARKYQRGLWRQKNPMPPWKFRQK